MGRTCGEPNEIKKNTHPENITALIGGQVNASFGSWKPFVDRAHARGIGFGIHLMQGIPRVASGRAVVHQREWGVSPRLRGPRRTRHGPAPRCARVRGASEPSEGDPAATHP